MCLMWSLYKLRTSFLPQLKNNLLSMNNLTCEFKSLPSLIAEWKLIYWCRGNWSPVEERGHWRGVSVTLRSSSPWQPVYLSLQRTKWALHPWPLPDHVDTRWKRDAKGDLVLEDAWSRAILQNSNLAWFRWFNSNKKEIFLKALHCVRPR